MISSLWEIHLTKFAFFLSHLLKTQSRKILPWTRNSKQKLIFGNNGSRCFQHKIYSARSWQLPTGVNIPLGCCLAPCQLSGSSCKALPGFCVPEQSHHVQCFGQASRSPNESAYRFAYWGRDQFWEPCDLQVGKHQKRCFGQVALWDYPARKAGYQLKACMRTASSQVCRRRQRYFRASPKTRTGLWGLADSTFNHPNTTLSSLEAPGACFAGHSATHTWQKDDSACMLRHKGPAFPRGIAFPPA